MGESDVGAERIGLNHGTRTAFHIELEQLSRPLGRFLVLLPRAKSGRQPYTAFRSQRLGPQYVRTGGVSPGVVLIDQTPLASPRFLLRHICLERRRRFIGHEPAVSNRRRESAWTSAGSQSL